MPNNNAYISAQDPVLEGKPDTFSRSWFRFLSLVASKIGMLDLSETTGATAGTAAALPATPQGYFTIIDSTGVERKVPYYNA